MTDQYIIILISMAGIFCLIQFLRPYVQERIDGKLYWRLSRWSAFLLVTPIIYFAWQRGHVGDTTAYIRDFESAELGLAGLEAFMENHQKDQGFYLFLWITKALGFDYRGWFLIGALFQGFSLYYIYRKYSCDYFLSILLYVLSTDYISWMLNGLRQGLAVSICFLAAPLIFEKKLFRASLIILIASAFHKSAVMMVPIIFIIQGQPFNLRTLAIILASVLAMNFVSGFTDLMDDSLQDTQYKNVVTDYTTGELAGDDGTNPLRVFLYAVPTILALIGKKRIDYFDLNFINISVNLSVMSTCLYLVSMVTSGIFIGRLPIYCSLYNYILLPWEIRYLFSERSQVLINVVCILVYGLFCYVSLVGF